MDVKVLWKWEAQVLHICWHKRCFWLHVCVHACVRACDVWNLLWGKEESFNLFCAHSMVSNFILFPTQETLCACPTPIPALWKRKEPTPYVWAAFLPRQRFSSWVPGPELPQREGKDEACVINVLQAVREKSPNTLVAFRKKKKKGVREKKEEKENSEL